MQELRIMVAGSGGQGILFMGKLLAYSCMSEGKEVTWFPSYGAEMRGGTANCTVIMSEDMIGSPIVRHPEILIVMNRASLDKFQARLKTNGILIYDSSLIKEQPARTDIKAIGIPASRIAASIDSTKSANIVLLGGLLAETKILRHGTVINALSNFIPEGRIKDLDKNKEALFKGKQYIRRPY